MKLSDAKACAFFDVRCEIAIANGDPSSKPMGWYERVSTCFHQAEAAIESKIRKD
jgi:hypothetical protein